MLKKFEDLRIGDKFYPVKNGKISLRLQCIKISQMELTADAMLRLNLTETAFRHLMFNCVVIESTNNINGYYHFLHDSDPVDVENLIC